MNRTMNPLYRVSSRTQTASLLNIWRMLRGQHLLLYRDFECHAFGIYNFVGSILRVVLSSAHMLVPSATSFVLLRGFESHRKSTATQRPNRAHFGPPVASGKSVHILYVKAFITTIYSACQEKSPLHAVCDWWGAFFFSSVWDSERGVIIIWQMKTWSGSFRCHDIEYTSRHLSRR